MSSEGKVQDLKASISGAVKCLNSRKYTDAMASIQECYDYFKDDNTAVIDVLPYYCVILFLNESGNGSKALSDFKISFIKEKGEKGQEMWKEAMKIFIKEMDGDFKKIGPYIGLGFYGIVEPFQAFVEIVKSEEEMELKKILKILEITKKCKANLKNSLLSEIGISVLLKLQAKIDNTDEKELRNIDEKIKFNS